jgi:hypothetical protein
MMNTTEGKEAANRPRAQTAFGWVLQASFDRVAISSSKNEGDHVDDNAPSNTHIFDAQTARLNAMFPWNQFA